MLASYKDITSRIQESPKWFDTNGVPRYGDFSPGLIPNIYADECLLYEIACQACGRRFMVEENWWRYQNRGEMPKLSDRVRSKQIHYGDPPCFECGAGATMNCEDIKTVQFWSRENPEREWRRVPELEGVRLDED